VAAPRDCPRAVVAGRPLAGRVRRQGAPLDNRAHQAPRPRPVPPVRLEDVGAAMVTRWALEAAGVILGGVVLAVLRFGVMAPLLVVLSAH
jgi:hypothetical protein